DRVSTLSDDGKLVYAVRVQLVHYFFFFSSRRRHTRCYRDWSSDVCSSDLTDAGRPWRIAERLGVNIFHTAPTAVRMLRKLGPERSEERRVGKECRSGWSRKHGKEKEGSYEVSASSRRQGRRGVKGSDRT